MREAKNKERVNRRRDKEERREGKGRGKGVRRRLPTNIVQY